MKYTPGVLVAYATAPGGTASDAGSGGITILIDTVTALSWRLYNGKWYPTLFEAPAAPAAPQK